MRFYGLSCGCLSASCIDQDLCETDSLPWPHLCSRFLLCLCLSCSDAQCLLSLILFTSAFLLLHLCLFPVRFLSLLCTRETCCRHIVFIARLLKAGPGLAAIGWLMQTTQLNMQHFPFSSLSHQEIDQSQP